MSLEPYFKTLLQKVESSDEITNAGKDGDGFYMPVRSALIKHLNLLHDLHAKPAAKTMVKASWQFVSQNLPPDWLVLSPEQKAELKKILS